MIHKKMKTIKIIKMEEYNLFWGLLDDDEMSSKVAEFESELDADTAAYDLACEEYNKRPLRTVEEIMDEDEVSEDIAADIYADEREENIEWYADPVNGFEEVEEEEEDEDLEEEELLEE